MKGRNMQSKILLLLFVVALVGCSTRKPRAAFGTLTPASAEELDNASSIIDCESRAGFIYVTLVDESFDAHIFNLDYSKTGLTKREAVKRIKKAIEAREDSEQSTGE
jgi:hypothetical protein